MKSLADQVREFMEREGLSLTEFARLCGTSRQNLTNVVRGSVTSPHWIAGLATAMRTTTDALLKGSDPPPRFVVRGQTWPFEFLSREQWAALSPAQRAVVDHAAAKAAAEFRRDDSAEAKRQTGT